MDNDLREALVRKFAELDAVYVHSSPETLADAAIGVISNWTADEPHIIGTDGDD